MLLRELLAYDLMKLICQILHFFSFPSCPSSSKANWKIPIVNHWPFFSLTASKQKSTT
ncbi:hypothetical protein SLEP1_g58804 [Rubroshorea leprosula]|uniref:Uncharacterized protein n=1 Tax=Rubroshorea leprosula TaxID=152421 RepID=A0AAV5MRP0_9ROSI|nr:hypothetical protein SLEP1_g58804 [Rubroshorea leprosula]